MNPKVNETTDEPKAVSQSPKPDTARGRPSSQSIERLSSTVSLFPEQVPTEGEEGFMHALRAVQQLRERNYSLREENAGLVQDLISKDAGADLEREELGAGTSG